MCTRAAGAGGGGESALEADAEQAAASAVAGSKAEVRLTATTGRAQRFDSYEHKQLGDVANKNVRLNNGMWLSYGQAVALSGDFYSTPEHLMNAPPEEVTLLLDLIEKQGAQAAANQQAHGGNPRFGKPTDEEGAHNEIEAESITSERGKRHYDAKGQPGEKEGAIRGGEDQTYSDLADKNETHFAGANVDRWEKEHGEARRLAGLAHDATRQQRAVDHDALLNQAYVRDAFACHFLTDAFSSGHLLSGSKGREAGGRFWDTHEAEINETLRRAAIRDGRGAGYIFALRKIVRSHGRSLTLKLVHDALNSIGVRVRNREGRQWKATGDQCLARSAEGIELAQEAARRSRAAIDAAANGRRPPPSPTLLVPNLIALGTGGFVPIENFAEDVAAFEHILAPLMLLPGPKNKLYRLLVENVDFGVEQVESKAGEAARAAGHAIERMAEPLGEPHNKGVKL